MSDELTDYALSERLPPWGVLVLESHHSPRFTMDWRTHAFVKVVYVLSGEGAFCFSDHQSSFSTADVVVVPPGTANRIEDAPGSASSLYICCLSTSLFHFDDQLVDRFQKQTIRGDGHLANRVASLMRRMVHTQQSNESHCALSMVSDALQLSQRIFASRSFSHSRSARSIVNEESESDRPRMEQYIDSLRTDFFEATTIDAAAESVGMSRRAFTKRFTEMTGKSWLVYVRELAVQHAKQRLGNTNVPIASIAFECGFNDLSTFYRQFKRHVGESPAAYRKG
ncbi:AraC family transcriptional regulator [Planctomycetes bacterium K23_9]|uniref:HTH-type transcriptional regulator YesS n=1 Tax=Stieleria marina TaxID=1930275 RepID=A0A517NT69_9BACT|nr:HTH-type transcriptional regulator YesS [Planctomycetes bacterium K23_9]